MDNLILLLASYAIMGIIINMATSTSLQILKPYIKLQQYALTIALLFSGAIIITFNMGLLTALNIPQEFSSQPYFHIVDLVVSSIVMSKGAQAVHKLIEGIEAYRNGKK